VLYRNDYEDSQIIGTALKEKRIILTRDRGILKNRSVTHGYWVRQTSPMAQAREVVRRFDLGAKIRPFSRCTDCNALVERVDKEAILERLEPKTARYFDEFHQCPRCGKVYWKGSHYQRMKAKVLQIKEDLGSRDM
jgi:uncharacterized protein with PIN domain